LRAAAADLAWLAQVAGASDNSDQEKDAAILAREAAFAQYSP
jgi:hypothetical protein